MEKERSGKYLGNTVQVIPHVTNQIKDFIKAKTNGYDFVICEIGGTVGDIESLPFLEAIRQFSNDIGKDKSLFVHLTLVPYLKSSEEIKTKPTQHSVKELRSLGIQPDIIVCRSEIPLPKGQRKKISLFCNVNIENVIQTVDVKTIYEAPISFYKEKFDYQVLKHFNIKNKKQPNLKPWYRTKNIILNSKKEVNISVVGKYVDLKDAYKSIDEALIHGGLANGIKVNLNKIDSEKLKKNQIKNKLKNADGILIPGGFGKRGTEGKIQCIKFARENKIPFFGICFGMQLSLIEFARNVLKLRNANSTELNKNCIPVIGLIEEWYKDGMLKKGDLKKLGGTMRLGSYECNLNEKTMVKKIYKSKKIYERHRHRYEVNIAYKNKFESKGLIFSGLSNNNKLTEIIELNSHPWFVGVQFHPEFKSRPLSPHPLFASFIKAAKNKK